MKWPKTAIRESMEKAYFGMFVIAIATLLLVVVAVQMGKGMKRNREVLSNGHHHTRDGKCSDI